MPRIALRQQRLCGGIRRGIADRLRDGRAGLGVENEVYEGVRIFGMRRAARDRERVLPHDRSLPRHDVGDIAVLRRRLQDVAVPLHRDVHRAREQQVLPVVRREQLDVRLLRDDQLLGRLDVRRVARIERMAQVLEGRSQHRPGFAQKRAAPAVAVRVVEPAPAVGHAVAARPAVADAHGAPHVRDAVAPAGIEGGVPEGRLDIRQVGDGGAVEGHEHPGRDHALDDVVGRHDHVVAGIAALQPREQLVIVREQVHPDRDARPLPEVREGGLPDVGVPVVEVELRLFPGEARSRQDGETGRRRSGSGKEAAACRPGCESRAHRGLQGFFGALRAMVERARGEVKRRHCLGSSVRRGENPRSPSTNRGAARPAIDRRRTRR